MFKRILQWKAKIEAQLARLEHENKEARKAINNIHKRNLRPLIQEEINKSDDSKVEALISPQEKKLHRLRQKGVI